MYKIFSIFRINTYPIAVINAFHFIFPLDYI